MTKRKKGSDGKLQPEETPPALNAVEETKAEQAEAEEIEAQAAEAKEKPLEEQLKQAQAEAEEYLDGWQRARAEFANYKKRTEREREETRATIAGEIITRYLGVMDDLERALAHAPRGEGFDEWIEGIDLIYQKLKLILDGEGIEEIQAEGQRFDPNFHEAISFEEDNNHEEGTVIEVTQPGYKLGDRVLRPAMVRVAK